MVRNLFLTTLCALAFCPAFAQTSTTEEKVEYSEDKYKVETNRFWSNWFIIWQAFGSCIGYCCGQMVYSRDWYAFNV